MGSRKSGKRFSHSDAVAVVCHGICPFGADEWRFSGSRGRLGNYKLLLAEIIFVLSKNDFSCFVGFVMVFVRLEQMNGASLGNARMDQHLLPYYQQDIANGLRNPPGFFCIPFDKYSKCLTTNDSSFPESTFFTARSSSNFNYDLETILKRGMKSYLEEAETRLSSPKMIFRVSSGKACT